MLFRFVGLEEGHVGGYKSRLGLNDRGFIIWSFRFIRVSDGRKLELTG